MSKHRLKTKLENYVKSLAAAPAQKSAEWYAIKSTTIGGSEIATIMGINPFKTPKEFLLEKAGLAEKFSGNTATRWGNMFEDITQKYTCHVLKMDNTDMFEAGSINGFMENHRYSPDGIGVVQLKNDKDETVSFIILFEFKSPLRSMPEGKIPKYYKPQVLTGLVDIPLVAYGIFVNNCYRKCSIDDISFDMTYDKSFHDGDKAVAKKKILDKIPQAYGCGIIGFVQSNEQYHRLNRKFDDDDDIDDDNFDDDEDLDIIEGYELLLHPSDPDLLINAVANEQAMDLGIADELCFGRALELLEHKKIGKIYSPIVFNYEMINQLPFIATHGLEQNRVVADPKAKINKYVVDMMQQAEKADSTLIAYLPYKICVSDILLCEREEDWQKKLEEQLTKTFEMIDLVKSSDDPVAAVEELFPTKSDVKAEEIHNLSSDMQDFLSDMKAVKDEFSV